MTEHYCSRESTSRTKCGGNNKGGTRDRSLYLLENGRRSCFAHLTADERSFRSACSHSLAPSGVCSYCGAVVPRS